MGWFGGSKEEAPSESNFTSSDDGFSGGAQGSLGAQHEQLSAVPGAGMASLEQFAAGMQQRMAVNQVVSQLSKIAFEKCIDKPSSELSGYEHKCIEATALKALDSQKFIMGRIKNLDAR